MDTIGNRAWKEIKKHSLQNGISFHQETLRIGITTSHITSDWKRNANPSAYYLQMMCLAGYDVIYILTGERRSPDIVKVETNIYDQEEIYPDCTVQVLTNTATGETSVGWWKNG